MKYVGNILAIGPVAPLSPPHSYLIKTEPSLDGGYEFSGDTLFQVSSAGSARVSIIVNAANPGCL